MGGSRLPGSEKLYENKGKGEVNNGEGCSKSSRVVYGPEAPVKKPERSRINFGYKKTVGIDRWRPRMRVLTIAKGGGLVRRVKQSGSRDGSLFQERD